MDTTPNDFGEELYRQNGIRIVGKYVDENSFWGTSVLLFIENETKQNVEIICDDMSINGFMVSPIFCSTVYSERYTVDDITILSSDLADNEIEKVKDIELKFRVINVDTYDTIFETPSISFSVTE